MRRLTAALAAIVLSAGAVEVLTADAGVRSCKTRITGTNGDDRLAGTARDDRIRGLRGDDDIDGRRGDDCIDGGSGADELRGGSGDDSLAGARGHDALDGGDGRDRLSGGSGNDRMESGPGGGTVIGGAGADGIDTGEDGSTVAAGSGDDAVSAANGVVERIDCGPGTDFAEVDSDDVLVSCENATRLPSGVFVEPAFGPASGSFSVVFRARRRALPPGERFSARLNGPPGSDCGYAEFDSTAEVMSNSTASIPLSPWRGSQADGTRAPREQYCVGSYAGTLVFADADDEGVETIGEFRFEVTP